MAPGRFTAHELGAIIARVLGRPIEVREIDAGAYLKAWAGDADPWLLGRSPTTFEAYVRAQQELFTRTGDPLR